jgi:hypothetical protein
MLMSLRSSLLSHTDISMAHMLYVSLEDSMMPRPLDDGCHTSNTCRRAPAPSRVPRHPRRPNVRGCISLHMTQSLPGYAPFLSHWRSILFVLCLGTLNSFVNWRESRCELSLVLAARWDLFFVVAQMNWHFILLVHAAIGLYFWSRSSSLCAQILIQRRQRELQGELRCCRTSWYGPLFETSKTELLYMH